MEDILEIIESGKELKAIDREAFAKKIKSWFNTWDEDRQTQIDDARAIMGEVYLKRPLDGQNSSAAEENWKADVRLNRLYTIKEARTAAIWREVWSNPSQMFDVKGTSRFSEETAKIQKAAIVDALTKMRIGRQFDEAINNYFDIGEMIFATDWEKRTKILRRRKKGEPFVQVELPYYENARVKSISPFMFVFDHSAYEIGNRESWDSCVKIFKRFETLENIEANRIYTLTKEQAEELKRDDAEMHTENRELEDLRDESAYGNRFEVLYCHGDFKIDGILYKNYIAEVLAGRFLIRFEKNPMFINPFILCATKFDPETKRGISPLKAAYKLCKEQEKAVNTSLDMQELAKNPPTWVNEDLVDANDSDIKIYPGVMKKYKNSYSGEMPRPFEIGYQNGFEAITNRLDKVISDVSSSNANMSGNIVPTRRTATELTLADKGASAAVSKELDIINQDAIIPIIENIAELLAMFKDGVDIIYARERGEESEYEIDNVIRQSQYKYVYEDRNALFERKSRFGELFQIFQGVAQDPEMRQMIDWREVIETAVEMVGFDNPDKFFVRPPAGTQTSSLPFSGGFTPRNSGSGGDMLSPEDTSAEQCEDSLQY